MHTADNNEAKLQDTRIVKPELQSDTTQRLMATKFRRSHAGMPYCYEMQPALNQDTCFVLVPWSGRDDVTHYNIRETKVLAAFPWCIYRYFEIAFEGSRISHVIYTGVIHSRHKILTKILNSAEEAREYIDNLPMRVARHMLEDYKRG